MIMIKKYNDFTISNLKESTFETVNNMEIKILCNKYSIFNYKINSDLSLNVDGHVIINYNKDMHELPLNFKNITEFFDCSKNNLKTFKYCPIEIGQYFDCSDNQIRTFDYFPKYIIGEIYLSGNPISEIWELFKDIDKVELFNEYDIFRDYNKSIILERLNIFLMDINMPIYDKSTNNIKSYKLI